MRVVESPAAGASRPVRMRDVADRAGVSTKTVSEVVNGVGQVSDATRERVLAAVLALDYRPNPAARGLALGRTGAITLALPHLGSGDLAALAAAVIAAAEAAGLGVLLEPTGGDPAREADVLRGEAGVSDGVLLVPASSATSVVEAGAPVVVLGDVSLGADAAVDHVLAESSTLVGIASAHLRDTGRRRVVVLGGPGARADIVAATADADGGFTAVTTAVAGGVDLDGLVALDGGLALGALHALRSVGIAVPSEVGVVAIGAGPESAFATPSVSALEPDLDAMARRAVGWLEERIAGADVRARRFDVPARLVVRESSAA